MTPLDAASVELSEAQLAELAPFGTERAVAAGDVLYRAGDDGYDFFVVLEGEVEIVRREPDGDVVVAAHGAGRFLGELNLLTGQRAYLTARVTPARPRARDRAPRVPAHDEQPARALRPDLPRVRRASRARCAPAKARSAIRIIGSRYSPAAIALRAFANRSRLPHTWIDLEDEDDPAVLLAGIGVQPRDAPVVVTPTACSGGRHRASSPSISA